MVEPSGSVERAFLPNVDLCSSVVPLFDTGVVIVTLCALHNLSVRLNSTFNYFSISVGPWCALDLSRGADVRVSVRLRKSTDTNIFQRCLRSGDLFSRKAKDVQFQD
jgi:hypothetical protein